MRTRAKSLTLTTSMVAAIAIVPVLGLAAEGGEQQQQEVTEVEVVDPLEEADAGTTLDDEGGDADDRETSEELEDDSTKDEEPAEEPESDDVTDTDEVEDAAHGERVSTVAECAPRGRDAREARLPNHGYFVSAAARGLTIEFGPEDTPYNLEDQADVAEFCLAVEALLGPELDSEEPDVDDVVELEDEGEVDDAEGRPAHAGPPAHAGRPDHAGPKDRSED